MTENDRNVKLEADRRALRRVYATARRRDRHLAIGDLAGAAVLTVELEMRVLDMKIDHCEADSGTRIF